MFHGYGLGMWGGGMWGMLVFWALGIWATVWLIRSIVAPKDKNKASSALDILDERFAKGDIDEKEYLARKEILS